MNATQEFPLAGRVMADLGQQVRAQRERARAAEAHAQQFADALDATLKVLRDLEWDAAGDCPWCHYDEHSGHGSDCSLATALQVGGER